jgi:hypothetical protein
MEKGLVKEETLGWSFQTTILKCFHMFQQLHSLQTEKQQNCKDQSPA